MTSISRIIRSCGSALCYGVVLTALLLAGCDTAAVDGTAPQAIALADASHSQTRVDVCHVDGQGNYSLITVADAAYDTHIAHGDGGIGNAVPDDPAYVFDADCQPVPAADCPCFSAENLASFVMPEFNEVEDGSAWESSVEDVNPTGGCTGLLCDDTIAKASFSSGGVYGCYLYVDALNLFANESFISQGEGESCRALLRAYQP
jgi:hypothetical protein